MRATRILRYVLPAAPLGLAILGASLVHSQSAPTNLKADHLEVSQQTVQDETGAEAPDVSVKVNGIEVPNGQSQTEGGTTTVHSSGGSTNVQSQTTRTVNDDGSVSIHITSNVSNSSGGSKVRYRGSGEQTTTNESSLEIKSKGTGSISASN